VRVSASTPLFGIIGAPVHQSLSPILQNGWIADHSVDGVYVGLPVDVGHFDVAIEGLFQAGLRGANITAPFKEQAAHICKKISKNAKDAQSVNCLTRMASGFVGDTTDGAGFIADLDSRASGWREIEGQIVILGAGGAARAILQAMAEDNEKPITVVNRNLQRAQTAIAKLNRDRNIACDWSQIVDQCRGASLIINATSAGLNHIDPLELDLSETNKDCVIYDSVYAPRKTAFLQSAQLQNRFTLDGLGMLVGQGALAFEKWFGERPDILIGLSRLEQALES
jgi:shikimate dehydrogenase